jgi:hypothetical protein
MSTEAQGEVAEQESENKFTADDLNLVPSFSDEGEQQADASAAPPVEPQIEKSKKTIAGESVQKEEPAAPNQEEPKAYWPDNWREQMAERYSAGDKKIYDKELTRLKRFSDPTGLYGHNRELESKFTGGGLVKIPGKDSSEEEIQKFHRDIGVPERPEDYFNEIELSNGAVIGETDRPTADSFANAVHKEGVTPKQMSAMFNWYYQREQEEIAAREEADDNNHYTAEKELKEEFGPQYNKISNAIPTLFKTAPGGIDIQNENSLMSRLLEGRMKDGRIVGDDPDMVRWLSSLVHEVNPAATVVDDISGDSAKTIDSRLSELEEMKATNPKKYWSAEVQDEELRLLSAQQKIRAKA